MTSPVGEVMPQIWSAATDATPMSAPTSAAASSSDASVGGLDSNSFLQLLVAQLRHQDPLKPTDSTTYITQEAQFSMVQSMNALAKQNEALLRSQQMQEAVSFIGKSVTYVDANGVVNNGIVSSASPGSDGAVVRIGGAQVPVTSITAVMAASGDTTTP